MTKKRKTTTRGQGRRAQAHKQQRQRQQMIVLGAFVLVALVAAALVASQSTAPLSNSERFELDPVLGDPDAPITLIEYGAYGCHACKQWHEFGVIDQILAEFPGQVNFIYRDMPIIDPAYSQRAAEVAQCGLDQGNDAFWSLHDAIFVQARQGAASQDDLIALGTEAGLDENALRECVAAGTHRDTVRYDLQRGRALGINATPTWLINDERIFNASPDVLRQYIQRELAA